MPGNIKGIIVEIGGDTSKLQKALNKVNSQSSSLSKELKGINSLLKLDPKNVELLSQKQEILNQSIDTTQDKLQQLQKIKEEADKKMASGGKISEENYRNLQREIISTQNKLNGLTDELKQFNAENTQLSKASKKIEEYGNKISKVSDKVNDLGNKASIVSGAVVAGGATLVNSAMSVEDAVAKYVSTTNTATNETEKYKTVLENINKANYGDGYEDIANSMAAVKMQLKDINDADLENITEKAITLRDLFGYDVSESIRAVKALMDNFNITADESFNLIAEGKKQGLDFSNELLDNVNEYSVQFKKLGLSAEDMFNIFKVGSENGAFNLDKIGDAVKEFSIRTIDGSNTTIDGFKRIGLNADEMAKKFANGGDVAKQAFIEVVNRLGSMDDKVSQSIAGVDLFGTMWEDLGPTVISSFSKMDAGISKSSNSMQDSIDELYDTTKKKAETQLKRLQSLGADFGEEMLPVLEKIIDKAEDFIDCLENMSDEEKENVAKIALLVAGFGPLTKVVGSSTSAIKGLASILKLFGGTASATAGIIGIGTAAMYAYHLEQTKVTREANSLRMEIEKQSKSFEDLKTQQEAQLESEFAHINTTQSLWNELKKITDENGKIKSGYEERAKVITSTLSEALGKEIDINDNVIQSYKDLQTEIDETIRKKKAQAIINAEQEAYDKAIAERTNAEKQLMELEKKIEDNRNEYAFADYGRRIQLDMDLQSLTKTYQEQKDLVSDYNATIADYEYDFALMTQGSAESLEELMQRNAVTLQTDTSNLETETIKQIGVLTNRLTTYKDLKNKELEAGNEVNAKAYQQQMNADQEQLQLVVNSLKGQITKVEDLTPELVKAYGDIAGYSTDEFNKAISGLPEDVQKVLNELVWTTSSNTTLAGANATLGDRAAAAFKEKYNSNEGKIASDDYIEGAKNGIKSSSGGFWNLLFNIGSRGNSQFRKGLGDGSPSVLAEKALTDYFAGAEIGADKSGKQILDTLNKYGKEANNEFNKGLNKKTSENELFGSLSNSLLKGINEGNFDSVLKLNRNIIMQGTNIPKNNINNNVYNVNIYTQTLDENKLEQCFKYVNRKFGNIYS